MCGIFGVCGKSITVSDVVEGIKKLEYRGYDSGGVAYFENGKINIVKKKGHEIQSHTVTHPRLSRLNLNDLKNELGGVEPAEAVERILKKNNKVNLDKGKLIYKNIKKFGFPNKLQWAIENWGTKYNAIEPYFEGNRLYFESVSTTPIQIIKMVSEELKDMIIQHIWIDEMFGKECGFDEYCNGEKIFSIKPDVCSVEAYKLYIECYGSDSCIRIDDNGGYYKIMCDKCSGCGIY